jgi:hypothetical protein
MLTIFPIEYFIGSMFNYKIDYVFMIVLFIVVSTTNSLGLYYNHKIPE